MIALLYVQAAEGPAAHRTANFAELRRQLDAPDADITLVTKRLGEAHGMYIRMASKYCRMLGSDRPLRFKL